MTIAIQFTTPQRGKDAPHTITLTAATVNGPVSLPITDGRFRNALWRERKRVKLQATN